MYRITLLHPLLNYKSIDTAYTTAPIVGAVEIIRVQYEYYKHSVQNLPIFIHASIKVQPTGGSPLGEVSLVLSYYETEEYVGLAEENNIEFNVYPNPANDKITIDGNLADATSAIISDQSGRIVRSFDPSANNIVNIADLESGIYILSIESNGTLHTEQIVKK